MTEPYLITASKQIKVFLLREQKETPNDRNFLQENLLLHI